MNKIFLFLFLFAISNTLKAQNNFTYMALGDSYTIGESVEADKRFPIQLYKRFKLAKYNVEEPVVVARTGWTTSELLHAIEKKNIDRNFDLVTLLIGVNNQYRGENIETYRKEFKTLLDIAIEFAQDPQNVIVISIPDWGLTPFALQRGVDQEKTSNEIDEFNLINKEETLNSDAHYVNITDISRKIKSRPDLLAPDGLHPSKKMYSLWVDRIYRVAKQILTNKESKLNVN